MRKRNKTSAETQAPLPSLTGKQAGVWEKIKENRSPRCTEALTAQEEDRQSTEDREGGRERTSERRKLTRSSADVGSGALEKPVP